MTAWTTEPDGGTFTADYVYQLIDEGGPEQLARLAAGLVNLAGFLLVKRAAEVGMDERATLQELAAKYTVRLD